MNGMPTVPIGDLVIHPRDGDLIAGTHGRSVYIVDISPLQQLTSQVLSEDVHLFTPKPALELILRAETHERGFGDKRFVARNPVYGATLSYYLKSPASDDVKIAILDKGGKIVRELPGPKERGINRVQWDLCFPAPPSAGTRATDEEEGAFNERVKGPLVAPGSYTVQLTVGARKWTSTLTVEPDPLLHVSQQEQQTLRTSLQSLVEAAEYSSEALRTADTLYRALAPSSADQQIADALKQLGNTRTQLRRMTTRVNGLYNEENGSPFPPTVTQAKELSEINGELDKTVGALNQFIASTLPGLSSRVGSLPPVKPIRR